MNPIAPGAAGPAGPGVRLFVCGDVMTGRGIDQILPHPGAPQLYEGFMHSAVGYVELAERECGPLGRGLGFTYPWGDALHLLDAWEPAARIVNLETAVTAGGRPQPGKGIHYRMHPANMACLTGAGIDCAVLANNHVLDWGRSGLGETLDALRGANVCCAGAGRDAREAAAPAVLDLPSGRRLLVFAFAAASSGVPPDWAATGARAGVNYLDALGASAGRRTAEAIGLQRRSGDLVVVSIHWGGNWGFEVADEQREFARVLIESGAADLVHGHSSHHVQAIELVRDKLVLYGCGDLINDYEGIAGHEAYRPDLALLYFPMLEPTTGELLELAMVPLRRRRLRLEHASAEDAAWLARTLQRESELPGAGVRVDAAGTLCLTCAARRSPTAAEHSA